VPSSVSVQFPDAVTLVFLLHVSLALEYGINQIVRVDWPGCLPIAEAVCDNFIVLIRMDFAPGINHKVLLWTPYSN